MREGRAAYRAESIARAPGSCPCPGSSGEHAQARRRKQKQWGAAASTRVSAVPLHFFPPSVRAPGFTNPAEAGGQHITITSLV